MLAVCVQAVYGQSKKRQKDADKQTSQWRYEIEPSSVVSAQGTCVIKVWSYSKDPRVATEQAKKNAVHAVIFKGVPSTERTRGFKALITDQSKEAALGSFFATGGDYMRYVSNTTTGVVDAGDVIKISKKEYKVGVTVTVQHDELRKRLEQDGLVRKLTDGF